MGMKTAPDVRGLLLFGSGLQLSVPRTWAVAPQAAQGLNTFMASLPPPISRRLWNPTTGARAGRCVRYLARARNLIWGCRELSEKKKQGSSTRTRTNTIPYGTEANAAG